MIRAEAGLKVLEQRVVEKKQLIETLQGGDHARSDSAPQVSGRRHAYRWASRWGPGPRHLFVRIISETRTLHALLEQTGRDARVAACP